jgi:hypothetical protein
MSQGRIQDSQKMGGGRGYLRKLNWIPGHKEQQNSDHERKENKQE